MLGTPQTQDNWVILIVYMISMGASYEVSKAHFLVCLAKPWRGDLGV